MKLINKMEGALNNEEYYVKKMTRNLPMLQTKMFSSGANESD